MIVKVFPSDVISIPKDYNNAKGRCCKYEVIGEVADYERNSDEFRQRAEAKASELAYDYEDNGCEDEAWEEYCKANPTAQFEADLYYAMNGGQDRETHSTKELNADELMVDNIIKSQLKTLKSTTVRRVAKSTKPYLNCSIVLDIVNDLGYNVTHDEGTPVSSAEISYIAK
jgi:hypothetical protein